VSTGDPVRTKTVEVGDGPGLVYCFNSCTICDPSLSTDYETYWWNDAVFYEIFVRSFYDSDGDGIGDFQGIIEKLDYLNDGDPETDTDLGITGIWLMPMMESPSYHGYDVTNYYATEPDYGSMQDFEELLDEAHARGIKIIIDFVMNHCSNQHPWFQQSINSQNGYRDWFRWSDNHPGYNGPWGQPVWHSSNGDFYYGLFWSGMPDLNYSHPPVKEELFDIAEFWLDKGVDGFRLDAIKYLDEDGSILENTPETFQILEDFHQLYKTNNPDALTVGEVWSNTASIIPYVQNDRLDVCFDFDLAYGIISAVNGQNPSPVEGQLQVIQNSYPRLQYATFLTNHDINRIFSQLGSDVDKMKLAASIYLTLPGIPFVYYGEEVGMTGTGAHENIRRPMQWSDGLNAGFSTASPWISLGSNYTSNNVEGMESDPVSLLNQYRKLIHIRNDQAALRKGYLLNTEENAGSLLSYARIYEEEAVIIAANTGTQLLQPELNLPVSTLPPGEYFVTELLSENNWGTLTINSDGGFENWYPNNEALEERETHVLLLSKEQMVNSTSESSKQLGAELFPNPASGVVTLRLTESSDQNIHLQILTSNGQLIREQSVENAYAEIDISDLATGLYFVKLQLKNGEGRVLRLVVEH
jgi:alpha-amylase